MQRSFDSVAREYAKTVSLLRSHLLRTNQHAGPIAVELLLRVLINDILAIGQPDNVIAARLEAAERQGRFAEVIRELASVAFARREFFPSPDAVQVIVDEWVSGFRFDKPEPS